MKLADYGPLIIQVRSPRLRTPEVHPFSRNFNFLKYNLDDHVFDICINNTLALEVIQVICVFTTYDGKINAQLAGSSSYLRVGYPVPAFTNGSFYDAIKSLLSLTEEKTILTNGIRLIGKQFPEIESTILHIFSDEELAVELERRKKVK